MVGLGEESAASPRSSDGAERRKNKRVPPRIVHTKPYEPTLLFVDNLCGPGEVGTQSGFTN